MIKNRFLFITTLLAISWLSNPLTLAANLVPLWGETHNLQEVTQALNNTATTPKRLQQGTEIAPKYADELRLVSSFTDKHRVKHSRYDQYFSGIPVFGQQIITHTASTTKNSNLLVTGQLVKNFSKEIGTIKPAITTEYAMQIAMLQFATDTHMENWTYRLPTAELIIYIDTQTNSTTTAKLAYKVMFFASKVCQSSLKSAHSDAEVNCERQNFRPIYIIDAKTQEVITTWDDLQTTIPTNNVSKPIKNIGTGPGGHNVIRAPETSPKKYYFGNNYGFLHEFDSLRVTVDEQRQTCTMSNEYFHLNDTASSYIRDPDTPITVKDEKLLPPFTYRCLTANDFKNHNDNGKSPVNSAYSPNNDAFYFATKTVDMYKEKFEIADPYATTEYGPTFIYTHINDYENASATAMQTNNGKILIHQQIMFGNGGNDFRPLTEPDIVAHELGHIFTDLHADLIYRDQSGAINESFSDIMGMTFKHYLREKFPWYTWGSEFSGWIVGSTLRKTGTPLRYFYDPTLDKRSIASAKNYKPTMNVHNSSGVFNHAYYLMSTKYTKDGLNPFNAAKLFVDANVKYWTPSSTFNYAACGIKKAAADSEYTKKQLADIDDAFLKVGVECVLE